MLQREFKLLPAFDLTHVEMIAVQKSISYVIIAIFSSVPKNAH